VRILPKVLVAGMVVAALGAVPTSASASADLAATRPHQLKNGATGMCLAVGRGEVKAGKKVIQWPCNGGKDQKWFYNPDHRLVNAKTGMCLAIGHGETRKGTYAIQWPCTDGGIEQEWAYDEWQRFQNRATGLCLAVGKSEAKKGKKVIQWTCKYIADQAWYAPNSG
jgi:hypothetical protein